MIDPGNRKGKGLLVLFAGVILLVLLFVPLWGTGQSRFIAAFIDWMHFPLFVLMTAGFLLLPSVWRRLSTRVVVVVLLVLLGLLIEWIQPWFGRSTEMGDLCMGWAGVAAGVCVASALSRRASGACVLCWFLAGAVTFGSLVPVIGAVIDERKAREDFPLLASFESIFESGRWLVQGCEVARSIDHATHGDHSLRIEFTDMEVEYPGLFLSDTPPDWQAASRLCMDVFVSSNDELGLWVRVDDRPLSPYAERVQRYFPLAPGANHICVDKEALTRTPSGRELDMDGIVSFGFFFDGVDEGETVYVDHIRLVL